jgi:hypothetical protein
VGGGGGEDGCHDTSEPATDKSPLPSSCGMSAVSGKTLVGSLGGSLGGWRCRLRFAGCACGDGLVVAPAPLPAAPTAVFLASARIRLVAAAAFVIAAAAVVAAAAAGALVAVEATTAAEDAAAAVVAAAAILFAAAVGWLPAVAASAVATMAAAVAALSSAGSLKPAGLERRLRLSTQAARLRFSCACLCAFARVYVPASWQAHAGYS